MFQMRELCLCKAVTIGAYVDLLASIARATKEFPMYSKIGLMSLKDVSSNLFAASIHEISWHKSCCKTYSDSYTSGY